MRIPPAVAREIGQMYAAANVNDTVARELKTVSSTLLDASSKASRNQFDAALVDATKAIELIGSAAARPADVVSNRARTEMRAALDQLGTGIQQLFKRDLDGALATLGTARSHADAGQQHATDEAAGYRYAADQLSREWL